MGPSAAVLAGCGLVMPITVCSLLIPCSRLQVEEGTSWKQGARPCIAAGLVGSILENDGEIRCIFPCCREVFAETGSQMTTTTAR